MKKIIFLFLIILPAVAFAQDLSYDLSAPIPGGPQGKPPRVTDLSAYISYLFPFLLSIAAILALVMFVYGGIEYMISASVDKTTGAKDRIKGALMGLGLAVFSVLILSTINPKLVTFELDLEKIESAPGLGGPGPGPGNPGGPGPGPTDPDKIGTPGICGGSYSGDCPAGQVCARCESGECTEAQSGYFCKAVGMSECPKSAECKACTDEEIKSCKWADECISIKLPFENRWQKTCK